MNSRLYRSQKQMNDKPATPIDLALAAIFNFEIRVSIPIEKGIIGIRPEKVPA